MADTPLSTEPYKGVRDFYPEDMRLQTYIFDVMRATCESFGFSEYSASPLEPTELYIGKTSEEIINEQTYTFEDRGKRSVTLRPEMTPSVTRMVAAHARELNFPLRWYSIPNLFRYERPQRGRLREHWQLNADIFGAKGNDPEAEIILLVSSVLRNFGAKPEDFRIEISDRKFLEDMAEKNGCPPEKFPEFVRLLDKRKKMEAESFKDALRTLLGEGADQLLSDLADSADNPPTSVSALLQRLKHLEVENAVFNSSLARGFDYYTGMVFEVFDTSPLNNRSMFGGGRYDDLMELFSAPSVPAVGFGMGDVTLRDFLETRKLIPKFKSPAHLFIGTVGKEFIEGAQALAERLRRTGLNVSVNLTDKKIGSQIKIAAKDNIPFVITFGENEAATHTYPLKNLETKEEKKVPETELPDIILSSGV